MHFEMQPWADASGLLIGRDNAESARAALEVELRSINAEAAVGLDFRDVEALTVSFAEGFFVPLLGQWLTGYYEQHPLVVFGANEEVRYTIDVALRLRNLAVLSVTSKEALLLGAEQSLRETAELAHRLGEFSAAEVADELGISLQAANNRLKDLVQRGALARVAEHSPTGGRQYRYRSPRAPRRTSRRTGGSATKGTSSGTRRRPTPSG